MVKERGARTHLAQRVGDLLLFTDIARVERDVVVALDNVQYRDRIATGKESLDDVPPEETAATDDQVDVFLASRHGEADR